MDSSRTFDSGARWIRNGFAWVPGVYFAEGLPYTIATLLSSILFLSLGMSNSEMAFWTSLVALPWSFKFLWAPFVDAVGTKRFWMLSMQAALAVCFAVTGIAFGMSVPVAGVIAFLFLAAFLSATHDIAADGYYMLALSPHDQAVCSGVRNIFYKVAMLAGSGGLLFVAGRCGVDVSGKNGAGSVSGWFLPMMLAAGAMGVLFVWHFFVTPRENRAEESASSSKPSVAAGFAESFRSFFRRRGAVAAVFFLFFYRFAEAQLGKMSGPFLVGSVEGGLTLTLEEYSVIYSGIGMVCFFAGGVLSGIAVGRFGFGKCLIWMAVALNVPDLAYMGLSFFCDSLTAGGHLTRMGLTLTAVLVSLEQFGYGLGYMAHVLFMVQFADRSGAYKASHFALMTGITILGMTLVGMFSGRIQQFFAGLGMMNDNYTLFFGWVCLCTIPSFFAVLLVKPYIDPLFGRRENA